MNWQEHVLNFTCAGEQLFGVATVPSQPKRTGVVVIVGGPQYRVGSHRQFVLLARRLASEGFPVLRFDYRGMGDSLGAMGHFESVEPDVGAAVDALASAVPGLRRVVLWGLCDGASAALLYLQRKPDPRVIGLLMLNPWIRTAVSQARTQVRHYYLGRLKQPDFWTKLIKGKVAAEALKGFMVNLKTAAQQGTARAAGLPSYPTRMAEGWQRFQGQGLLLLSEQDYTAREFEAYCDADPAWSEALRTHALERKPLIQADHTCSQPAAEAAMHQATIEFLNGLPDS